jgi:hypothetical protein
MNPYIIANPPCGIYRGDLTLGYAYYQTLLDIHSIFLSDFRQLDVVCHKYSLNALGKRAENLGLDGTIESLDEYVYEWIDAGSLRDKMNLSFKGNLLDTSPQSIKYVQKTFEELYEKGYVLRRGATFFLDVQKIGKDFDLQSIIQKINFFSERGKKEFIRVLKDSTGLVRITKKRAYSIANPLGGEEIAPIFVISNLWGAYFDQEIDFMAASEKELTRYLVLRFLSQVPFSSRLPMKNIFIYNYIVPEGGFDEWNVAELAKDGVGSDSLRYAFAKSCSLSKQKTEMKKSLLNGGRKLILLVGNLKKLFCNNGMIFVDFPSISEEEYLRTMDSFRYSYVLEKLEIELREVSRKINKSKDAGKFESSKTELFEKYISLVRRLSPFCPFICNKVISNS